MKPNDSPLVRRSNGFEGKHHVEIDRIPQGVQSEQPRLSRRLSRRRDQPLPRLRADALADRPSLRRVRILLDRAAAQGSVEPRPGRKRRLLERRPPELRRARRRLTQKFPFPTNALGYIPRRMKKFVLLILLASSAPAWAGASNFTLVNGTKGALAELSIRRAGTAEWKTLGAAPSAGARGSMQFSDPDCAFDIRATGPGSGPGTWAGVNLCDLETVTLQRDPSAGASGE